MEAATRLAREQMSGWPRLIPILGHRYISGDPCEAGNPVWSMWQSDIIVYGAGLGEYFDREFINPPPRTSPGQTKDIPFWSEFIDYAWSEGEDEGDD